MQAYMMKLPVHEDSDCACGKLVAIESERSAPFAIRRVYYIYDVADAVKRGAHAHKASNQLLVTVHGSCTIRLDDGAKRREFLLDRPDRGLLQPKLVWGEMTGFTPDTVLMVLSDDYYDANDYIHDYAEFLQLAGVRA